MLENSNLQLIDNKIFIKKINDNINSILKFFNEDKSIFSSDNLEDLNEIIQCLQELENERFKAHEIWETESIKFEALRNKLINYPDEITDEIQRAIRAARGMNEDTIRNLKETLEKINANIDRHSKDLDRYNQENEKLLPEFEQMKVKHEEIVVLLNQHLSKKADKQIDLNEIRGTIKNYNENIIEMEEDVFQMKEAMIKDRAAAREEKKRLLLETNKTQKLLNIQNEKNDELNKIYQNLKHEATETSLMVTDKLAINQKFIKTIEEICERQRQIEESIENITWSNEQKKQEIQAIEKKIFDSKFDFDKWKSQISDEIQMISDNVKMQEQILLELKLVKEEAAEELEKNEKIKDEVSIHLRSLMDKLRETDENGAAKVSDIGQLEFEMEEMERNIITSKENHEAMVATMKGHLTSLQKQLEKERKDRMDVQRDNSDVQDQINIFRGEHMKFMRDINTKINDCKSEHSRLSVLYQQLKNKIKEEMEESEKLKIFMKDNKEKLLREDTELTDKIALLNRQILEMEKDENEKRVYLEDNEPRFKELQIYYDKHMKDYDQLKKDLAGLRNRKSGLEDAINRTTKSLEKENIVLDKLLKEKILKEEKLDTQLQMEAEGRSTIEKNIYVTGCKISTVKEEIWRLKHEIQKMDNRTRMLRDHWEEAIHISSSLKQESAGQKSILQEGWKNDQQLENSFKKDEMMTINRLKELLQNTEQRKVLIAEVSDKLFHEIDVFDQFLANMSTVSSSKIHSLDDDRKQKLMNVIGNLSKTHNVIKESLKIETDPI